MAKAKRAARKPVKSKRASSKPRPKRPARKTRAATRAGKPAKARAASEKGPVKASRIEMADGDLPVQAYITSLPTWKREVALVVDELIGQEVRDVRRAIKWSAAFYGVPEKGWFASMKAFTNHVKITFFRGTKLRPVPPSGTHKDGRSIDISETDTVDEDRMRSWIRQAAALPGWGNSG